MEEGLDSLQDRDRAGPGRDRLEAAGDDQSGEIA
jgi:hypothetical protein